MVVVVKLTKEGYMVYTFPVYGLIEENAYFYIDDKSLCGFLIDPGAEANKILALIKEKGWKIEKILITHGHFDHILGLEALKKECGAPVYACAMEKELLMDTELNSSADVRRPCRVRADHYLIDGESVTEAGITMKTIFTPGHTEGSCCYYIDDEKVLFSGDTLFAGSYGRTDLPTGSQSAITKSIKEKLLVLPPDVQVYPGHEDFTTIEQERKSNPILL